MSDKGETMKALVLRVCGANGESYGGFRWPLTVGADVKAPDWKPTPECGNGLHGWLYGAGDHGTADINGDSKWLVVEVDEASIVMIDGKCKYPRGVVRFVGAMHEAAAYIIANEPRAKSCAVIGAVLSVGTGEVCSVGAFGTATAGDSGTATAGERGSIVIGWYDRRADRYRRAIGYVGEDGIEANVAYRCDEAGKLVKVDRHD